MSWENFLDRPIRRPAPVVAPASVAKPPLPEPANAVPRRASGAIDFVAILKRNGEPMTQADLADRAGCSIPNVCTWFSRHAVYAAAEGLQITTTRVNGRPVKAYSIRAAATEKSA